MQDLNIPAIPQIRGSSPRLNYLRSTPKIGTPKNSGAIFTPSGEKKILKSGIFLHHDATEKASPVL